MILRRPILSCDLHDLSLTPPLLVDSFSYTLRDPAWRGLLLFVSRVQLRRVVARVADRVREHESLAERIQMHKRPCFRRLPKFHVSPGIRLSLWRSYQHAICSLRITPTLKYFVSLADFFLVLGWISKMPLWVHGLIRRLCC